MYKLIIAYRTHDNHLYRMPELIKLKPFVFPTLESLIAAYELLQATAPENVMVTALVEEEVTIKQKREVEKSLVDLKKMR